MSGSWDIGEPAPGVIRVRYLHGDDPDATAAELRRRLDSRPRRVLLVENLQHWPHGDRSLLGGERMPVIASAHGDLPAHALPEFLQADLRLGGKSLAVPILDRDGGVLVDPDGIARLSALVGGGLASYWVLSQRCLAASEALQGGLLDELVEGGAEALGAAALAAAIRVAAGAPLALEFAKEALRRGARQGLAEGIELEADLYSILQTTADRREGVDAFLEHREPKFRGE